MNTPAPVDLLGVISSSSPPPTHSSSAANGQSRHVHAPLDQDVVGHAILSPSSPRRQADSSLPSNTTARNTDADGSLVIDKKDEPRLKNWLVHELTPMFC